MTAVWFVPTNTVLAGAGGDDYVVTPSDDTTVQIGQYGRAEADNGLAWYADVEIKLLPQAVRRVVEAAPAQPTRVDADASVVRALRGIGTAAREREA